MPEAEMEAIVAGAIFDFAGFLTSLSEPITIGTSHDAAIMVPLIERWAETRGLDLEHASVDDWRHLIDRRSGE